MINTSLFGFFVLFFGITSAEETSSRLKYVLGLNNTRVRNTLEPGTPSNGSHSAEGVTIIVGSKVDHFNNTYLTFEKVKDAQIYLPPAYQSENGDPKSIAELMTGPIIRPNVMNPERRLIVQRNIDALEKLSLKFKEDLYGLMMKDRTNISKLSRVLQSIMSADFRLQDQQKMLDDFNIVIPGSPPKIDHFDRDLATLRLEIESAIAAAITST
uniref:Uncharacterized protein n=1 Tax=Glyptapanteles flavicoxis TaxID=463051 RepID=B7S840_9HYME|nr:conserved hypothetical protein [Glyptapanteles flavicoxis]